MLYIIFGDCKDVIYNTSGFFKNVYEKEWLEELQTKQMILDIDKSKVISDGAIDSPVLGIIPPTSLSGGVKTLILIEHITDKIFNASNCGDNCAEWLLKIAEKYDCKSANGKSNIRNDLNQFNKTVYNLLYSGKR